MNRELQSKILNSLKDSYPERVDLNQLRREVGEDVGADLEYLYDHGLVTGHYINTLGSAKSTFIWAQITSEGLDFLEDDGGLSALRNTIHVRFDTEELKTVLVDVFTQNAPEDKQETVRGAIRSLPAAAVRDLFAKLLELLTG